MSFENRGGVPRPKIVSIDTTGQEYPFEAVTKFLQISNQSAHVLRLYFTAAAFDANDDEYISLAATTGYFEGPVEAESIWLRGIGGTTDVIIVPYHRRA